MMATLCVALLAFDIASPLPVPAADRLPSVVVTAADGTPLRAFADAQGVWRYPVRLEEVSPYYVETLLTYEDRWFYYHPGVNPAALLRAAWQWLRYGKIISGGSTLTMQMARILDPHDRSPWGKVKQVARALQMEWHYSKKEILELYLNYAPFGGPVEGVQAASFAYLGKNAKKLSRAEAALLTVLPQAPSLYRPDRHPELARTARDKVLDRMMRTGKWPAATVHDAKLESVQRRYWAQPRLAPLFAERMRARYPHTRRIMTTIDANMQWRFEHRLRDLAHSLPEHTSLALMVVDNRDLAIKTYVGSADLLDADRFGFVDMVTAVRSPGSTLKPFLYALALDDGLIHSESLLSDAPQSFAGYEPGNFSDSFSGPVGVREALQRSLNVPAVEVLDHLGANRFFAVLRNGGLKLTLPAGAKPTHAVILGGAGATLENLVAAYSALARNGQSGTLKFTPSDTQHQLHMMSAGAAWIVRDILASAPRPGMLMSPHSFARGRQVAWKTGTSYGFRDAWAIGVTDRYTIGVWVGRPDGTPLPGHYGAVTAAPILFDIVDSLAIGAQPRGADQHPHTVKQQQICCLWG
ncbi:MAG: penicillin-binding protein 1C [Gammaproteobacteria bacterium]|nr:penicillin-binding protein 1C [Gammaproteobacteria bacterium]